MSTGPNRQDRLIFIKTKKTGGTSFEIALSKYCGDDCIITPITPADEQLRLDLGFRGAQNFQDYVWKQEGVQTNGAFFNHIPADVVRQVVPQSVWREYKKITIVRNPFDVAISRYFWEGGEGMGMSFLEYLRKFPEHALENKRIAPLDGDAVLDVYLRYEDLEGDLHRAGLGHLWDVFSSIRAKGDRRPKGGTSIAEIYKKYPEAADIVRRACAEEIEKFNYDCG